MAQCKFSAVSYSSILVRSLRGPNSPQCPTLRSNQQWAVAFLVSGLEDHEIPLGRLANSLQWNPAIERHKPALMLRGEAKQIHVRNLPWTVDAGCIEDTWIKEAGLIRPELVDTLSTCFGQAADEHLNRLGIGIRGTRHDAHAAVLGERTGGPAFLCVPRKPCHRGIVRNVIGIE